MISRFVLEAEEIYITVVWIKPIVCLHLLRSAPVLKVLQNSNTNRDMHTSVANIFS